MTVEEYAPSLREDENSKFHCFAEGLKNHIRRAIVLFLRLSYAEVVNIAKDLEITWQEMKDPVDTSSSGTRVRALRRVSLLGVVLDILERSIGHDLIVGPQLRHLVLA